MSDPQPAAELVRVFCQSCGQALSFSQQFVGRKARCRHCGHAFRVPALRAAKPAASAQGLPLRPTRVPLEVAPFGSAPTSPGLVGVDPASPGADHPAGVALDDPCVISAAGDAGVPSAVLFLQGVLQLLLAVGLLILLFWQVTWWWALWLLLPVVAVFGAPWSRRFAYLLSAGTVRL